MALALTQRYWEGIELEAARKTSQVTVLVEVLNCSM